MDLDSLELLLTPDGQEVLALLWAERPLTGKELALNSRLRDRYPARLISAAMELTELRTRGLVKFSRAAEMYFTRDGLEQATSELIARHHARRFEGCPTLADLSTGIGGDLVALAVGREVLGVDLDPLHLRMAGLNAEVYGVAAGLTLRHEDAMDIDLTGCGAAFVDPARRRAGRRELDPDAYSPPLAWCLSLADLVPAVGLKAAPGLPREAVPPGWEVEFVSVDGDLKEAALWSPVLATAERRATLLPEGLTLVAEEGPPVPCHAPRRYLLDPDPAVTRAGAVETLARLLGAWKLDPEIAFLSADTPIETPFGRTLVVEDSLPWSLRKLRERLRELGVGVVDIRKRGSPVDVEQVRRQLRLSGERAATVVLTRVAGKPWALVCVDPRRPGWSPASKCSSSSAR